MFALKFKCFKGKFKNRNPNNFNHICIYIYEKYVKCVIRELILPLVCPHHLRSRLPFQQLSQSIIDFTNEMTIKLNQFTVGLCEN